MTLITRTQPARFRNPAAPRSGGWLLCGSRSASVLTAAESVPGE